MRRLLSLAILLSLSLFSSSLFAGPISNLLVENRYGSNPYYYEFEIQNSQSTITAAAVRSNSAATFIEADFSSISNSWRVTGLIDALIVPLDIRLTNDLGEVLTFFDVLQNFNGGAQFDLGANFQESATSPIPEPDTFLLLFTALFLVLCGHTYLRNKQSINTHQAAA